MQKLGKIYEKTKRKRSLPHFDVIFVGLLGGDQSKQKKIDLCFLQIFWASSSRNHSPTARDVGIGQARTTAFAGADSPTTWPFISSMPKWFSVSEPKS